MTNKKKILIETLHGSVAQLNELSSMTEGIDIYDDTGCVDTDFLIEAISCVSAFMDASNIVVQKISSLLAPDAPVGEKKKQADEGKKWNVEEILKHCTLENNILKLPQVQFNKKSYAEAKKWIEEAGGSWQGGKAQGFTFPFNPERVFSILKEGKRCNLQQEYQFLKRRLRWRTGWLCLPAEYMKMIRYWNRVPAAVLSLKPFIELVLL